MSKINKLISAEVKIALVAAMVVVKAEAYRSSVYLFRNRILNRLLSNYQIIRIVWLALGKSHFFIIE